MSELIFPPECNTSRKQLEFTCRVYELLRLENNLIAYWFHHGMTQPQYNVGLGAGEHPFKITTIDEEGPVVNDVSLDTEAVKFSDRTKVMLPKDVSEEDVPIYKGRGHIQEGFDARHVPPEKIPKGWKIVGSMRKLGVSKRHGFHAGYLDPKFDAVSDSLGILRPQFSNEDIEALGMEPEFDEDGERDYGLELAVFEAQQQKLTTWDSYISIEDI